MKTQTQCWVAALALATFALGAQAQTPDFIINEFDTPDEATGWVRWWGAAPQTYEHDAAVDADGDTTSGSLRATIQFNNVDIPDNQFAVIRGFPQLNGLLYTNLVFDLRWDPSSPQRIYNDHGNLDIGFRVAGFGQTWLRTLNIPTNTAGNWIRVVAPIRPTFANLDTVSGVVLKMWGGGNDGLNGTATFWVDNVKLIAITNDTPIPPPTMSIARPEPGLNLMASHETQTDQRQSIRTVNTANSWIEQFDPVTYAITIAKFPDAEHSNFQAHMFLAPAPLGNPNDSYVDYNAPHIIFWQIANNDSGGAYTRFMIKTNQPSGNSQLWGAGTLALIGSASPLGRWSLTFSDNTNVSMTTPDGSVTNFTLSPEMVAFFGDGTQNSPLYAYFGVQPNNAANIGQQAILSRIEIIRESDSTDDQFAGPTLDGTRWAVAAFNSAGVAAVPPDAIAWVKWTLPDVSFTLEANDDMTLPTAWGPLPGVTPAQIIDYKRVLLTPANTPWSQAFFRMHKPQ